MIENSEQIPEIKRAFLLLYAASNCVFLSVHRKDDQTWGLPGGKVSKNESPLDAIIRETQEEIGYSLSEENIKESYRFSPVEGIGCLIYMAAISRPFVPTLNTESLSFKWSTLSKWPQPTHPQMQRIITENSPRFKRQARNLAFPD